MNFLRNVIDTFNRWVEADRAAFLEQVPSDPDQRVAFWLSHDRLRLD